MNYVEFKRNIGKAGLTMRGFGELIKANPNSITNLSNKNDIPKNLSIIAVLLGELVDKGIDYNNLFEKMDLEPQKARGRDTFSIKKGVE